MNVPATDIRCPSCEAKAGEACRGPADWKRQGGTHAARAWRAANIELLPGDDYWSKCKEASK